MGGVSGVLDNVQNLVVFFFDGSPKLFLSMLCGVPTPIVPLSKKVSAVSPFQYMFFLCGSEV